MCLFTSARTVAMVFARSAVSEAMYCAGVLTFDGGFMDSSCSREKCIAPGGAGDERFCWLLNVGAEAPTPISSLYRPLREPGGRPLRPMGVSGWWTGGGSLPEARASRARRRVLLGTGAANGHGNEVAFSGALIVETVGEV